jgi:hypothetical protein
MSTIHYWACRLDTAQRDFLLTELDQGRLRQGWGWLAGQDLRNRTVDQGAKRNERMLEVKKGDVVLIPSFPKAPEVLMVEAAEDWADAYRFEISNIVSSAGQPDYGHIFPVTVLGTFARHAKAAGGDIRRTLRNAGRFWNIDKYADSIERIRCASDTERTMIVSSRQRLQAAFEEAREVAFDRTAFTEQLYKSATSGLQSSEWENALVEALRTLYPAYTVKRTGGKREKTHGTDILIQMPGLLPGSAYGIAIQVKDYEAKVSGNALDQISKAENWKVFSDEVTIVEKVVCYIGASRSDNLEIEAKAGDTTILFKDDVKELLGRAGMVRMGIK